MQTHPVHRGIVGSHDLPGSFFFSGTKSFSLAKPLFLPPSQCFVDLSRSSDPVASLANDDDVSPGLRRHLGIPTQTIFHSLFFLFLLQFLPFFRIWSLRSDVEAFPRFENSEFLRFMLFFLPLDETVDTVFDATATISDLNLHTKDWA